MKLVELPLLKTKRLTIKLLEPRDAHLMVAFRITNKIHLREWEPERSEEFYTEKFWLIQSKMTTRQFQNGVSVCLVIMDVKASRILGVCNYTNIVRGTFQACQLGYSIDHAHEGQGIMFEALQAANKYIFDNIKLHRIMAHYIPRNKRSGELLRRLGFVIEGRAESFMKINGMWEEHILTSLINRE